MERKYKITHYTGINNVPFEEWIINDDPCYWDNGQVAFVAEGKLIVISDHYVVEEL